MRPLLVIVLLACLAPFASAQRTAMSAVHTGSLAHHHARSFFPLAYAEYYDDSEYSAPVPTPVFVAQAPPASAPVEEKLPADPLMIELQGERYVRVGGENVAEDGTVAFSTASGEHVQETQNHSDSTRRTLSSILVFRDGHREEVPEYTIANGVVYVESNFYTAGAWTRKVALSSLDVAQTLRVNQSRGTTFRFSSSPNEVVVGP